VIDLTKALPPTDERLYNALQDAAAHAGPLLAHHGYHPIGLRALRVAIAARYEQRGVPTTPDQILVTSGAQQAIDLIARTNVRHREAVIVESPTYAGAMDSLRLAGARLVSLDVSAGPWDLAALEELIVQTGARLAYLMPDFQNPTGRYMPDDDRRELVRLCRRYGVTLVVDETLAEIVIDQPPPAAPVAAHDRAEGVVTVGSLSKSVWAGLRVGWIRSHPRQLAALAATRSAADLGGAPLEQLAAAALVPQLDDLMDARRDALRLQRDAVLDAAGKLGWRVVTPGGGLSAWASLPGASASLLADVAYRHGVLVVPGPRLSPDGVLDRFVRLPYGLPVGTLDTAVARLAQAWREMPDQERPDGMLQVV
jgi:DNA-binding transcriptional MocR family regulator